MYLSKLEIDMRSPSARQALLDCQDMHRNLMRAFTCSRREAGVLYRLEKSAKSVMLYVFSMQEPAWERLADQGYRCCGVKEISALRTRCVQGDILAFSLRACPTRKVFTGGKNSRRVFLKTEEERLAWLRRQAEKGGFELLAVREESAERRLEGMNAGDYIRFSAIDFTGLLRISDADRFWATYCCGFGAEKAYGMGLMLLKSA